MYVVTIIDNKFVHFSSYSTVPVPISEYYQQNKTFWVLKAY
jgi:hypothetical protein